MTDPLMKFLYRLFYLSSLTKGKDNRKLITKYSKDIKPIVDTIKKIIKDKNTDSPQKVQALKLLNECLMQSSNEEFLIYMEKKILSRLLVFAKHKKESTDLEKGADLFDKSFNKRASADFLKLLLVYIQKWAHSFPAYHLNGKQTEISKSFQTLAKQKVYFPSEEAVIQSLCSDYDHPMDISRSSPGTKSQSNISIVSQSINGRINQFGTNSSIQGAPQGRPASHSGYEGRQSIVSAQSNNLQGQAQKAMSREKQIQMANKIKADYKKLYEFENNAKLAEEILSMSGQGEIDSELLLNFRQQLTEGKEFSQGFLNTLMETPFTIKDKESKIEKIISINSLIENALAKILVFKPYTASELQEMKRKQLEKEQQQQVQSSTAIQESQNSQRSISSQPQNPQETHNFKEEAKMQDPVRRSTIQNNNSRNDLRSHNVSNQQPEQMVRQSLQEIPKQPQQPQLDFAFDKNQFKTDNWFSNNANASFDFNAGNLGQSEFKWSPEPKQQNKQNESSQFMIQPKEQSKTDNRIKEDSKNSMMINGPQTFQKPNLQDKFRTSSQMPMQQIQQQQQPMMPQVQNQIQQPQGIQVFQQPQIQQQQQPVQQWVQQPLVSQKPQNNPVQQPMSSSFGFPQNDQLQSQFDFNFPSQQQQPLQKAQDPPQKVVQEELFVMKAQPSPMEKKKTQELMKQEEPLFVVKNQPSISPGLKKQSETELKTSAFGVIQKQQFNRPQITSPDDNISDEDDHIRRSDEKEKFQMPASNEKLRMSMTIQKNENNPFQFQKPQPHSEEKFDFGSVENPLNSTFLIEEKYSVKIDNLNNQIEELKQQNDELKLNLRKQTEKQRDYENKYQTLNQRIHDLEQEVSTLENEKLQLKKQNEDLNEQLKQMSKYEFLYEDEKLHKVQLQNENKQILQKVEDYKKMAERNEAKLNKKEKEVDAITDHLKNYEKKLIEMKEQYETDLEDIRKSDNQTKVQLQNEIFESRKKEDELRIELQKEIQESKKREQFIKNQWLQEMQEYQEKEDGYKSKVQILEAKLKEKEEEFDKLKKQKQNSLVIPKGLDSEVLANNNKIVLKSSNIKFSKDLSDKKTPPALNDQNKFDFSFPAEDNNFNNNNLQPQRFQPDNINISPSLYSSCIKAPQTQILTDVKINKFEPEETNEIGNQQMIVETEEIIDNIPSSDSDKESDHGQQHAFFDNVKPEPPVNKQLQDYPNDKKNDIGHEYDFFQDLNRKKSEEVHINEPVQAEQQNVQILNQEVKEPVKGFDFAFEEKAEPAKDSFDFFNDILEPSQKQKEEKDTTPKNANNRVEASQEKVKQNIQEKDYSTHGIFDMIDQNKEEDQPLRISQLAGSSATNNRIAQQEEKQIPIQQPEPVIQAPIRQNSIEQKEPPNFQSPFQQQQRQNSLTLQKQTSSEKKEDVKAMFDFDSLLTDNKPTIEDNLSSNASSMNILSNNSTNPIQQISNAQSMQPSISNQMLSQQNQSLDGSQLQKSLSHQDMISNVNMLRQSQNDIQPQLSSQRSQQVLPDNARPQTSMMESPQVPLKSIPPPQERSKSAMRVGEPSQNNLNPNRFVTYNPQMQQQMMNQQQPQFNQNPLTMSQQFATMKQLSPDQIQPPPLSQRNMTNQASPQQFSMNNQRSPPLGFQGQQFQSPQQQQQNNPYGSPQVQPLNLSQQVPQQQNHNQSQPPQIHQQQFIPNQNHPPVQQQPAPSLQQQHQHAPPQHIQPNPQQNIQQQLPPQTHQQQPMQQHQQQPIQQQQQQHQPNQQQPQQDIKYNTNQFTTQNTEQYQKQQAQQMQQQQKINPQAFLNMILLQFFRKSLLSNKSVLYEDQNIQIGLLSDYQPSLVRMRLFFMCKNAQQIQSISFVQQMKPIGFEAIQTRESIATVNQGTQEPIDISIMINSFQLSIPIYSLSYKCNNIPVNNLPIRLPMILLKLCTALSSIDNNAEAYKGKWERECSQMSEAKQLFNIDFNQCKSLTQLKEVLKLGTNAFAFADGVEAQKNILCGGTQFQKDGLYALVKVTISANGQNCEIVGRSNDQQEPGKFAKFILGNILELIALKVNPQQQQ